jgi:hypothetical protein
MQVPHEVDEKFESLVCCIVLGGRRLPRLPVVYRVLENSGDISNCTEYISILLTLPAASAGKRARL